VGVDRTAGRALPAAAVTVRMGGRLPPPLSQPRPGRRPIPGAHYRTERSVVACAHASVISPHGQARQGNHGSEPDDVVAGRSEVSSTRPCQPGYMAPPDLSTACRSDLGIGSNWPHPWVACGLFDGLAHEPRRHGVPPMDVMVPWTPRQVAGGFQTKAKAFVVARLRRLRHVRPVRRA
jgi:hypothetical protein